MQTQTIRVLFLVVAVALAAAAGVYYFGGDEAPLPSDGEEETAAQSFAECAAVGNPVAESYPRRCTSESGQVFTEDIGNELAKRDQIRIASPRPGAAVESPLELSGEARGGWFFEASFPVRLVGEDGALIAEGHAQAAGEWMTEEFVPFSASLEFETPSVARGTLILEKQNASGLPERADALRVPVAFAAASEGGAAVVDTQGWQSYESGEFGFRIKYPHGWIVHEFPADEIAPSINIVPLGTVPEERFPLTHHSPQTNVSIFPHGVPTEGVFSDQATSTVSFAEPTRAARDYLLKGGARWGTFASFTEQPDAWRESGFIFARTEIRNASTTCFSGGERVSSERCDPLFGDRVVRHGWVDESVRALERAMLESFRFTGE